MAGIGSAPARGFRPRWREFRQDYPRLALAAAAALAALLLLDFGLVYLGVQYDLELGHLRAAMTNTERQRVDDLLADKESRLALSLEMVRRDAVGDPGLNLAVDTAKGVMYLERQGARLREMPVRLTQKEFVGKAPDAVCMASPLGKRLVALVVDETYVWEAPEWVYLSRGLPVSDDRKIRGGLGSTAIFLDCGAVIYSRPATGPLDDDNYILPGSVRAEASDLEAIAADLQPGMAVYFY